ncbi:hypothetical protein TIFTF001_044905 [Ficus carica]|uniref:Uncharacterized protein n=1 Tax=Ficus carica TaxID=3494 RepID=A0AA88CXN3_FICCA|nr:hypothetical protein TIFTF001_044905 [Ficus carica]
MDIKELRPQKHIRKEAGTSGAKLFTAANWPSSPLKKAPTCPHNARKHRRRLWTALHNQARRSPHSGFPTALTFAMTKLLSNNRLEMLRRIRESEVSSAVKEVHDLWISNNKSEVLVDMKRWFCDISVNMILRVLVGRPLVVHGRVLTSTVKSTGENERCRKALRDFFKLSGDFPLEEALPFLRLLDLDRKEKAMKRTAKVLDNFSQGWLDEHTKLHV